LDRDQNAAKNILNFAVGQTVKGRGEITSPKRATARRGKSLRSVKQLGSANV
jgi:transposase